MELCFYRALLSGLTTQSVRFFYAKITKKQAIFSAYFFIINLQNIVFESDIENLQDVAFKGCDKLVFYGKANTNIEKYAKKHNIPFFELKYAR